jgi:hypothetical protein
MNAEVSATFALVTGLDIDKISDYSQRNGFDRSSAGAKF